MRLWLPEVQWGVPSEWNVQVEAVWNHHNKVIGITGGIASNTCCLGFTIYEDKRWDKAFLVLQIIEVSFLKSVTLLGELSLAESSMLIQLPCRDYKPVNDLNDQVKTKVVTTFVMRK